MQRVAVVTSHLQSGDAVSNDVIGMWEAFSRRRCEARVYCESSELTEPDTFHISEIGEFLKGPSDLLIYHHSIGWRPGLQLLQQAKCRTAVKYHNVTPPRYFAGVSLWHERQCATGLAELKEIAAAGCEFFLADSNFNREDLLAEGVDDERCFVVPPFHHIDDLQSLDADLATLDEFRDGKANILMVGRVAPHKKHDELIEAFALYHHDCNPNSRLIIAGKEEKAFASYVKSLRARASFFAIVDSVAFVGGTTLSELKSLYLLANVFATASEHEGFCVPLVEAMSMKIPVVAYADSAIPDTVQGAGIVLDKREPQLMAEAINFLIRDESLSFSLGLMGKQRYDEYFTNQRIETELFRAISMMETMAAAS